MEPRPPELANRRRPAQCRYIPRPREPRPPIRILAGALDGTGGPVVSARPGSVRATVGVTPDPGPKPARSGVGVGRGRLWRLRSSTQTRGTPRFTSSSRLPWGTCTWPPTCRPRTAQARVLRRGRPKLQLLGLLKWQARQLAQRDTGERATVYDALAFTPPGGYVKG